MIGRKVGVNHRGFDVGVPQQLADGEGIHPSPQKTILLRKLARR
jgi:hypothetical protein